MQINTITQQQIILQQIEALHARILGASDKGKWYSIAGSIVLFGCLVTEGFDDTDMILAMDGTFAGDEIHFNPDRQDSPARYEQYPNVAFIYGEGFFVSDINRDLLEKSGLTVGAAPGTVDYGRHDIVYGYVGREGPTVAIKEGAGSEACKTSFDANGLEAALYRRWIGAWETGRTYLERDGVSHGGVNYRCILTHDSEEPPNGSYWAVDFDPAIPAGCMAFARVYIEYGDTGIANARIADIRDFTSRLEGESGYSGISGFSGYSGFSGISGYSGDSGISGYSGEKGDQGDSGISGYSGDSGISGYSGYSGEKGDQGDSGISGYSGEKGDTGDSGISGYSGFSGDNPGTSGYSGYSGYSGADGASGISGYSGDQGDSGISGYSGPQGDSGISGFSGASGISGYSGYSGVSEKYVTILSFDSDTDVAIVDGIEAFVVPGGLSGYTISDALAAHETVGVSGQTDVQIRRERGAATADVLSTKITISAGDYFAQDGAISGANADLAPGDRIYIDVDAVTTVAPKGLGTTIKLSAP